MEERDSKGRFVAGSIGNPRGRPKKQLTPQEVLESASMEAVTCLISLMHSSDDDVALKASIEVLNRTLGKPIEQRNIHTENYSIKYDNGLW